MAPLTTDGQIFITIIITLSALATICGVTRLMIRRHGMLSVDDYILAFCLVLLWYQATGATLLATKGGMGRPMLTLTPGEMEWLMKMFYAPEIGYTILVALLKLSILFSYKRIFGHVKKLKTYIHVLMGLSVAWGVSCLFVIIFQCWPIERVWTPTMTEGGCIDLVAFLWGTSISNLIIDWATLTVPLVPIWKLQMSPVQKALVGGSFALGSVACVASTVRAAVTGTIDVTDLSKSVFMASIWTYIEPTVAIISACLPFFSKFFKERVTKMGSKAKTLRNRTGMGSNKTAHERAITKRTTTTISDETTPEELNQHELMGYSVRVGAAKSDGRQRLGSESSQSLV